MGASREVTQQRFGAPVSLGWILPKQLFDDPGKELRCGVGVVLQWLRLLVEDGLHLNAQGYDLWESVVEPFVRR